MPSIPLFSSPPTVHFPFPYELAHLIITEYLPRPDYPFDNYAVFDALSRTSRLLRDIALPILYERLELNVQRQGFKRRMIQFIGLLRSNPLLCTFIRVLIVTDNTIQLTHRNEFKFTLEQTPSRRWFSYRDMREGEVYEMFTDEEGIGPQLVEAVKTMNRLQTVIISFVYRPLEWETFSTHFQSGFRHAVAQQTGLRNLFVQGVSGVPQILLKRFSNLERLDLIDVSIDTVADLLEHSNDAPEVAYNQNKVLRLAGLGLRNVPPDGALSLLNFWKEDAMRTHRNGVDMSHPEAIDIFFGNSKECDVPKQAILQAASHLTTLQLHALALGLDNSTILQAVNTGLAMPMEHPSESGAYDSFSSWFSSMALVQPGDLAELTTLKELSVQVSHWPDRVGPNEEIQWGLALLKSVPSPHLEAFMMRINIGHYLGSDNAALADFGASLEQLWVPWGEELRNEKWCKLKFFELELLGHFDVVAYDFRNVTLQLLKSIASQFPRGAFRRRKTRFHLRYLMRTENGIRLFTEIVNP